MGPSMPAGTFDPYPTVRTVPAALKFSTSMVRDTWRSDVHPVLAGRACRHRDVRRVYRGEEPGTGRTPGSGGVAAAARPHAARRQGGPAGIGRHGAGDAHDH